MSSKPSIDGHAEIDDEDVGPARASMRSSAASGESTVTTSAPAVSRTTRSSGERIIFVVDRQHADPG